MNVVKDVDTYDILKGRFEGLVGPLPRAERLVCGLKIGWAHNKPIQKGEKISGGPLVVSLDIDFLSQTCEFDFEDSAMCEPNSMSM